MYVRINDEFVKIKKFKSIVFVKIAKNHYGSSQWITLVHRDYANLTLDPNMYRTLLLRLWQLRWVKILTCYKKQDNFRSFCFQIQQSNSNIHSKKCHGINTSILYIYFCVKKYTFLTFIIFSWDHIVRHHVHGFLKWVSKGSTNTTQRKFHLLFSHANWILCFCLHALKDETARSNHTHPFLTITPYDIHHKKKSTFFHQSFALGSIRFTFSKPQEKYKKIKKWRTYRHKKQLDILKHI